MYLSIYGSINHYQSISWSSVHAFIHPSIRDKYVFWLINPDFGEVLLYSGRSPEFVGRLITSIPMFDWLHQYIPISIPFNVRHLPNYQEITSSAISLLVSVTSLLVSFIKITEIISSVSSAATPPFDQLPRPPLGWHEVVKPLRTHSTNQQIGASAAGFDAVRFVPWNVMKRGSSG